MAAGVYKITHTASSRVYIGSSVGMENRWKLHRRSLNNGVHHSAHLQRAWRKYGAAAFVWEPVLICDVAHLQMYEQRLIDGLCPAFNMSASAKGPVQRGQKLPKAWVEKVAAATRARYASGFKIVHPPRDPAYRAEVAAQTAKRWADPATREIMESAIRAAMTADECAKRSTRTAELWAKPEYRERAIAARVGRAFNAGYKCTPAQVENRKRAARISNMKRNYGAGWAEEYRRRYPEHAGDVDGE